MNTCKNYGMLYGHFREVCKCHEEMQLRIKGEEMYRYLTKNLSSIYEVEYEEIIESKRFPRYVKDYPLPENKIINVHDLTVVIHFKILELLGVQVPSVFVKN